MNFKELLKKHGYNFSTLAKDLGVSRQTTNYWYRNKAIPRTELLDQISDLLCESRQTIIAAIREVPLDAWKK